MMLLYASIIVHPHNTRLQHAIFEHMDMGVPRWRCRHIYVYTQA